MKILIFLSLIPSFLCQEKCGVVSSSVKNAPNLDDFEFEVGFKRFFPICRF